jgi:hypothetical protein
MRRALGTACAVVLVLALFTPAAQSRRSDAALLVGRLRAIDTRLTDALGRMRSGVLPKGFAATVSSVDDDASALGHALPHLGSGPARGNVVYYGLRDADANLGLARKHIRLNEPGARESLRAAARSFEGVARELERDDSLFGVSEKFRLLAMRGRTIAADDEAVRRLMLDKVALVKTLPVVAGVRFGTFYDQSAVLHARLSHALRTTRHNEPEAVRNDLVGARLMTRTLIAEFRGARAKHFARGASGAGTFPQALPRLRS